MGELNERLLPRSQQETLLTCSELFPLFKEVEKDDGPRPGSKKRKQSHLKEVSSLSELLGVLSSVLPQYHCRIISIVAGFVMNVVLALMDQFVVLVSLTVMT
jgi:hypothetical protein